MKIDLRSMRHPLCGVVIALMAVLTGTKPANGQNTVVTIGFDDANANQFLARQVLKDAQMPAVFYVNSTRIGNSGRLTHAQLLTLQGDGHEIGGHTLTHARLTNLTTSQRIHEVCTDRDNLINMGFPVRSFAYPFGAENTAVHEVVKNCGYDSGRDVGGIRTSTGCNTCPFAVSLPPANVYDINSPSSIGMTTSLQDLKSYVTNAENNGGGWVQLVFHHICDDVNGTDTSGCSQSLGINLSTFSSFVEWLAPRENRTPGNVHSHYGRNAGIAGPSASSRNRAVAKRISRSL